MPAGMKPARRVSALLREQVRFAWFPSFAPEGREGRAVPSATGTDSRFTGAIATTNVVEREHVFNDGTSTDTDDN